MFKSLGIAATGLITTSYVFVYGIPWVAANKFEDIGSQLYLANFWDLFSDYPSISETHPKLLMEYYLLMAANGNPENPFESSGITGQNASIQRKILISKAQLELANLYFHGFSYDPDSDHVSTNSDSLKLQKTTPDSPGEQYTLNSKHMTVNQASSIASRLARHADSSSLFKINFNTFESTNSEKGDSVPSSFEYINPKNQVIPRDINSAKKWLARSASNNYPPACEAIANLILTDYISKDETLFHSWPLQDDVFSSSPINFDSDNKYHAALAWYLSGVSGIPLIDTNSIIESIAHLIRISSDLPRVDYYWKNVIFNRKPTKDLELDYSIPFFLDDLPEKTDSRVSSESNSESPENTEKPKKLISILPEPQVRSAQWFYVGAERKIPTSGLNFAKTISIDDCMSLSDEIDNSFCNSCLTARTTCLEQSLRFGYPESHYLFAEALSHPSSKKQFPTLSKHDLSQRARSHLRVAATSGNLPAILQYSTLLEKDAQDATSDIDSNAAYNEAIRVVRAGAFQKDPDCIDKLAYYYSLQDTIIPSHILPQDLEMSKQLAEQASLIRSSNTSEQ